MSLTSEISSDCCLIFGHGIPRDTLAQGCLIYGIVLLVIAALLGAAVRVKKKAAAARHRQLPGILAIAAGLLLVFMWPLLLYFVVPLVIGAAVTWAIVHVAWRFRCRTTGRPFPTTWQTAAVAAAIFLAAIGLLLVGASAVIYGGG
jgi:hypothetical protein